MPDPSLWWLPSRLQPGTVPLRSLSALSRIEAQTTDLSALRVALRLPASVRPLPRGVSFETVVKIGGEPDRKAAFRLVQIDDLPQMAGLPASTGGTLFYLFRFVPEDATRLGAYTKARRQVRLDRYRRCHEGILPRWRTSTRPHTGDNLSSNL